MKTKHYIVNGWWCDSSARTVLITRGNRWWIGDIVDYSPCCPDDVLIRRTKARGGYAEILYDHGQWVILVPISVPPFIEIQAVAHHAVEVFLATRAKHEAEIELEKLLKG